MKQLLFYQNNPCVVIREVNEDFAEIAISHKFAQNMETHGHCQGCLVGDSDNKLSCTCDDFSWIIEEFQEEENKLVCMVERRLLLDKPIEQAYIEKLQSEISSEKENLRKIKDLHSEWSQSLASKKKEIDLIKEEINLLDGKKSYAQSELERVSIGLGEKVRMRDSIVVEIESYSFRNKKIDNSKYKELLKKEKILDALMSGGVDNWEWYHESTKDLTFDE